MIVHGTTPPVQFSAGPMTPRVLPSVSPFSLPRVAVAAHRLNDPFRVTNNRPRNIPFSYEMVTPRQPCGNATLSLAVSKKWHLFPYSNSSHIPPHMVHSSLLDNTTFIHRSQAHFPFDNCSMIHSNKRRSSVFTIRQPSLSTQFPDSDQQEIVMMNF